MVATDLRTTPPTTLGRFARLLPVSLAVVATLVACGGSSDDAVTGDESNFTADSYAKILECENGSVLVDVDRNERRHLQLVVRDARAFGVLDQTLTYGQIKNPTERIYRGNSPYGIFDSSQFRHFRTYEVTSNASGQRPGVEAILQNGELRLRGLDLARRGCQPYSLRTDPPDDAYPGECEATNYVFRGCH